MELGAGKDLFHMQFILFEGPNCLWVPDTFLESGNLMVLTPPDSLPGNPFRQCFEFCVSVLCLEFKKLFFPISKDAYLFVIQCQVVYDMNKYLPTYDTVYLCQKVCNSLCANHNSVQ